MKHLESERGDGYVSDDSDFYGTVKLRNRLEHRSENANLLQLTRDWARNKACQPTPLAAALQPVKQALSNRLEGNPFARQLSESADDFVKRLPPRTTSSLEYGPWIWVLNPVVEGKGKKAECRLPESEDAPTGDLTAAYDLLAQFEREQDRIKSLNARSVQSTVTKKLNPLREKLKEDILDIAVACNLTSGKWMLFPKPQDLNRIWKTIVEAVIDGRLGDGAKVATMDPPTTVVLGGHRSESSAARLTCIYTKDFSDLEDVRRVLVEMVELGLAPRQSDGGAIYYKCDAYTILGLDSNNIYGMKASLYSSKDLLGRAGDSKRKTGRQSKLPFKKQKSGE